MRLATVYQRRDKFIVCPNGKTTAGVWIGIEPIVVLHTSEHEPLGCAVRRALHASRSNLRHPELEEWDSIAAPLYALVDVKTWGAFARGAELVSVEADHATIRLLPQENRGARDGFQPIGLPTFEVAEAVSDEELGLAVMEAMAVARAREPHRK